MTFAKAFRATSKKLWLWSPKYRIHHELRADQEGIYKSEPVSPGDYRIIGVGLIGFAPLVTVVEGKVTFKEVEFPSPITVAVTFVFSDNVSAKELHYVLTRSDGSTETRRTLAGHPGVINMWMVPGSYEISASDEKGRKGQLTFQVGAEPAKQEFNVTLRARD
ncbi:MAG: hypothetical protein O7E54_04925 [Planctomycetota bacterium]|nr:hypothetical protein [Planctomycetota bacterium]